MKVSAKRRAQLSAAMKRWRRRNRERYLEGRKKYPSNKNRGEKARAYNREYMRRIRVTRIGLTDLRSTGLRASDFL